jgi:hypothetical protein
MRCCSRAQLFHVDIQQLTGALRHRNQLLCAGLAAPATAPGPALHRHGKQGPHAGLVVIRQTQFIASLTQCSVEGSGVDVECHEQILEGNMPEDYNLYRQVASDRVFRLCLAELRQSALIAMGWRTCRAS